MQRKWKKSWIISSAKLGVTLHQSTWSRFVENQSEIWTFHWEILRSILHVVSREQPSFLTSDNEWEEEEQGALSWFFPQDNSFLSQYMCLSIFPSVIPNRISCDSTLVDKEVWFLLQSAWASYLFLKLHQQIQERGSGSLAPLPSRFFQNHAVFRQF